MQTQDVNHTNASTKRLAWQSEAFKPIEKEITKMNNQGNEGEAIRQLATLPLLEYDRRREDEAKRLKCRTSTLDKLVEAERAKKNEGDLQGEAVIFPDVTPWSEPVSGPDILNAISASFTAFCALPDGGADVAALWCAHTHCFELFRISPRLNITSPTYGCGKSTFRDAIALFVRRPLSAESLSTAVGFRVVNESKPTLLADEIDRWLINNEELCGFFNSNYKRGAVFLRCDPDDGNKVKAFNAYSPVVLCGIGALRGRLATLHDRSIVIRMERAKPGELLEPFDEGRTDKEQELNRKLVRWMSDNRARVASCNPRLPSGVHNRLADNWRPLFAIAEVLGGDWPNRCAEAFRKLTAKKLDVEARGIELLRDIRDILKEQAEAGILVDDWISSSDLIECLLDKAESPWGEANHGGKPINERWLSVRLSEYDIKPGRFYPEGSGQKRGYKVIAFRDALERYVTSGQVSQQPILPSKTPETDSETDRKKQVSQQVSQGFTRLNDPCETLIHLESPETGVLSKMVYPGDWIRLTPDETQPHWQAALKEALAKPCEVCGEFLGNEPYLWLNIETKAVRCPNCQEAHWWADGYEIDDLGLPSCWNQKHTRVQRIAERTRNQLQKAAQWRASRGQGEYAKLYQALLAQEPDSVCQSIQNLGDWE